MTKTNPTEEPIGSVNDLDIDATRIAEIRATLDRIEIWHRVVMASDEDPALKEMLEKALTYYQLKFGPDKGSY